MNAFEDNSGNNSAGILRNCKILFYIQRSNLTFEDVAKFHNLDFIAGDPEGQFLHAAMKATATGSLSQDKRSTGDGAGTRLVTYTEEYVTLTLISFDRLKFRGRSLEVDADVTRPRRHGGQVVYSSLGILNERIYKLVCSVSPCPG